MDYEYCYSAVVFVQTRPEIRERLSIGLFLLSDNDLIFNYSKVKLQALQFLLPEDIISGLESSLESLKIAYDSKLEIYKKESPKSIQNKFLLHLCDLHCKGNNLLAYDKPQKIKMEFNRNNYDKLYNSLIWNV